MNPGAGLVLAIDTATSRATLALGRSDGTLLAAEAWDAGHRHAEELLARIAGLLAGAGLERPAPGTLAGVIAGTGPGGYTGLRVGLATARGIARAAGAPLVGVPTGAALEAAARAAGVVPADAPVAVLLPAGVAGRYLVHAGRIVLTPPGGPAERAATLPPETFLLAVDLPGRAPAAALAAGAIALNGLAAAILELGAARLAGGGESRDAVQPEYVTLPRGVVAVVGEVAWSPARR